jgi:hypothetical protein
MWGISPKGLIYEVLRRQPVSHFDGSPCMMIGC